MATGDVGRDEGWQNDYWYDGDWRSHPCPDPGQEPLGEIDALLAERAKTHGNYIKHAYIAQYIKNLYRNKVLTPAHREALDMIAHKLGRIIAGDAKHKDHWLDIAGYAKLAANTIYTE